MSLHPSAGVRVLLDRVTDPAVPQPEGGALYRGAIFAASARADFTVSIDAAATVSVTPDGVTPDEISTKARDLLRAIARTIARKAITDEPPSWPRRVLRWRRID